MSAIGHPLRHKKGNALNPCFLAAGVVYAYLFLGALSLVQIGFLLFRNLYGPVRIKYSFGSAFNPRSVGVVNVLKLVAIGIQVILYVNLGLLNFDDNLINGSLLLSAAVVAFSMAPLHILEVTRLAVGHGSLIAFWLFSGLISLAILISDSVSTHKVYVGGSQEQMSLAHAMEVLLVLNAATIYVLEVFYYRPSQELREYYELNDWDIASMRNVVYTCTFMWLEPLFQKVNTEDTIELDSVPNALPELKSAFTLAEFKSGWAKEVERAKWWRDRRLKKEDPTEEDKEIRPQIFLVILRTHWRSLVAGLLFEVADMVCVTIIPFFLKLFINFFADVSMLDQQPPMIQGFAIAGAIYMASVVRYFSFNQRFFNFFKCSFGVQSALNTMIYEKALRLSPEAKKNKSSGDIVNHVAVDVNQIAGCVETMSDAITIPLRLVLCMVALYKLLGSSSMAGLATAVILVPLSSVVSASIYSLYNVLMELKDERTRLTLEILNAIKSIKLYSWEQPMLKRLDEVRNNKELVTAKRIGLFNAGASFLWGQIPFGISCAVYTCFAWVSKAPLLPSIIFPALSLFELLSEPILMLPFIFSNIAEMAVALRRLRKFLVLEEMPEGLIERKMEPVPKDGISVEIKNALFVWGTHSETKALDDINFVARKGQLTCIVGRVGAGKTTLLKSIIGEVPLVEAPNVALSVTGKIAYCAQSPWILNSTVRENILFGKRYDADYYNKTIEACQLVPDFAVLPQGDFTLVGEKGISLSGGQKARISLARAVYSKADVYLLDDVLSAVDAHVGKRITEQVLSRKGMLALKTLILATNLIKILRQLNEIVFLKGGVITERGSFKSAVDRQSDLADLIREFDSSQKEADDDETEQEEGEGSKEPSVSPDPIVPFEPTAEEANDNVLVKTTSRFTVGAASIVSFDHQYQFDDEVKDPDANEETSQRGSVKWPVYKEYLKACGPVFIGVWLLFNWATVSTNILGNFVLKIWGERNLQTGHNVHSVFYLTAYASTGVVGGILSFAGSYIIWTYCAISCSKHFHDQMAHSVLRSPMQFFDTTPIGRILNRFSDDISVLDQQILWLFISAVASIMETLVRFMIVIINLPFMFVVIVVLFTLYKYFRDRFISTSRELKRLQLKLRSPVFAHLQELVNGVETLRAYDETARFMHSMRKKVDNVIQVNFTNQCANRWLSMRLQSIAAIVVLASTLLILASLYSRALSPSLVGFLMTYVFNSASNLNAIIRLWSDTETKIVAVERLIEYGNLPSEAEMVSEKRPAASWPDKGEIHLKGYLTRYRENLDPVLKNVTLDVKQAEKIGIVGRTGAGKSSLTLALFRIIEGIEGSIEIDGLNIALIGLSDLRSQLNIIPQDAHAFEGTVRENLDPFGKHTDEALWKVLDMAHLKTHVESMKTEVKDNSDSRVKAQEPLKPQTGLDAKVLEGGLNLSLGQKQLLCLARALLKELRVLVLDEATAAVDVQTDKIIQQTIRLEFKDMTILTIAHRLDTIMDSDRIVVLEQGQVKEFDTPQALLANEDSEFYSMCKEGGYLSESESK